ncbi:MAG: hypothetical protein JW889_08245 [Verrucomicrobia bacterium]|nr:hypothetical protein [Verrucomicrobiota bacterium]
MRTLGLFRIAAVAAINVCAVAVLLTSCMSTSPPPRPLVRPGPVPDDRVDEGLARTVRAGTPIYYGMPIDEAIEILGPPHGELGDMVILRRFNRTKGARAAYWQTRSTTLYVVYDRRAKLVQNVIVVEDDTNIGIEVLVTRAEVFSLRITPGMSVAEALRIMGPPTRFEEARTAEGGSVDRLLYEPEESIGPAVIIEVDRQTFEVLRVSTAPGDELGPPPGFE